MATCSKCGTKIGFLGGSAGSPKIGVCETCFDEEKSKQLEEREAKKALEEQEKAIIEAAIGGVLLTTETYPKRLNITETVEIVTAECAFGMNIFKDLFSGVRDIVGGRSEAVQKTLQDTRRTALYELKKEAYEAGANAVVGVDLDYVELSAAGNMVLLVASGTAVRIEE